MNHFLSIRDLDRGDVGRLFRLTAELKAKVKSRERISPLGGRTMALIFEKPSLRTRVTFEVGMVQLGGAAVYLSAQEIGMGKRESVSDVARNLSRWVDGITARVFAHQTLMELARHATVPVINALSDYEHPCQAMADFFTLWERGIELSGLEMAWVGDGNNMCHSLLLLSARLQPRPRRAPGLPRPGRAGLHHHRGQRGGAGRPRHLHRRVDQHGTGGGAREPARDLPALSAQRDAAPLRADASPGHALPPRPSRRGDHRRRPRRAAEHRVRPGGESPPRPEGHRDGSLRGEPVSGSAKKVVLAYSGGLDTSVILRWLIETYHCDVIAYCADLGQGEELIPVRDKALRTGASAVHIRDLREEFVRDFIYPMLRANAIYEGSYLMGTSIARPLIAKAQVEIALAEGADAVSHGATGKGNDQVRFELTYAALAPELTVIAPWREWDLNSRTALMEFARKHDIPVPVTPDRPYSMDRNLFHISYEGGILEDPWAEPPSKMFLLTNSVEAAPDVPVY